MQQGNFIDVFLARHVSGTYAHHQENWILSCGVWFSAPSFWMGGGLDSRQKYLTIWQHSCESNCWRGEFVLERPSSETQNISVAMECWSVEHRAFAVETYF